MTEMYIHIDGKKIKAKTKILGVKEIWIAYK